MLTLLATQNTRASIQGIDRFGRIETRGRNLIGVLLNLTLSVLYIRSEFESIELLEYSSGLREENQQLSAELDGAKKLLGELTATGEGIDALVETIAQLKDH